MLRADRRFAVTVPLVLAAVISCSSAASVFLDIPEGRDEPPASATTQPRSVAAVPSLPQDTAAPRPPIEFVLRRDSVLALLPRDGAGNVDWLAALRDGTIRPRSARPGQEPPDQAGFRYDFKYRGDNPMFDASFPHSGHVDWVSCQSCHPAIYPYRDAEITMAEINQGESCGQCHGVVAFPVSACGRCHERMPLSNSGKPATFLGDLTLERKADSIQVATMSSPYPPARFPHWVHRIRYRCTACHPEPWQERLGSTTMTMSEMQAGELCGACHNGGDAFGLFECVTCHSPVEAPSDPEP